MTREHWLADHGRGEMDVMRDSHGEYICAESTWINGHTKCEVKVYLPEDV